MIYETRLNQLKVRIKENGWEVALITSPINVFFLTGFYSDPHERFMALVYDSREDRTFLMVPSLDVEAATQSSFVQDIIPVEDTQDPYLLLESCLGKSVKQITVEKTQMNLLQYEKLASIYTDLHLSNLESYLSELRAKKSREEIEIVKKAVAMVEQVLHLGLRKVTVGVTELDLVAELEYQMKIAGADRPAFSTMVLTGTRSALPHGKPGLHKVKQGDFLLFDLGVFVQGYCSDITRTFIVGEASEEQANIYQAVLEANQKAIQAVKSGEKLSTIDLKARRTIEAKGYGSYFIHRVGHGIGLEIHEPPSVHAKNDQEITTGLLFTIEPGIYVPSIGGVRIEDDVYVNENGDVEVLTSFPKELKNLC